MPIVWGMPPPKKLPKGYIRLLVVKPREEYFVCLLGHVTGVQTHWVEDRCIVCTGEEDCIVHEHKGEWKGYAAGAIWQGTKAGAIGNWRETVLVLTVNCGEYVQECKLRTMLKLSRAGNKARSALVAELSDRKLPACPCSNFDPRPYVLRAMGWPADSTCKVFESQAG